MKNSFKLKSACLIATCITGLNFAKANESMTPPCHAAIASFDLPENQCLPIQLDGSASVNEDNHFIEIVEVNQITGNIIGSTYYSNWFTNAQINLIQDLGSYTGYNFEHGKKYQIKVAVQNYDSNGNFCTGWNAAPVQYVTVNNMNQCYTNVQLYERRHPISNCITSIEAGFNCDPQLTERVEFSIGSNSFIDTQYSYHYYIPNSAPFAGTVSAKFVFKDGTHSMRHLNYQKCPIVIVDDTNYHDFPRRNSNTNSSTENLEIDFLQAFPNPAEAQMTIVNSDGASMNFEIVSLEGKTVLNGMIPAKSKRKINLEQFASGAYQINAVTATGKNNHKTIIVNH